MSDTINVTDTNGEAELGGLITPNSLNKIEARSIHHAVVVKSMVIFQLLADIDETLLLDRNIFLFFETGLEDFDVFGEMNVEHDRSTSQCLDVDLGVGECHCRH